jgi:hypothetical protein
MSTPAATNINSPTHSNTCRARDAFCRDEIAASRSASRCPDCEMIGVAAPARGLTGSPLSVAIARV